MKNELFIENRRTAKSQPTTVRSADCDIRHYPKGVASDAQFNAISIEVINRAGEVRDKELINIKFTTGMIWTGTFKQLQESLVPPQEDRSYQREHQREPEEKIWGAMQGGSEDFDDRD